MLRRHSGFPHRRVYITGLALALSTLFVTCKAEEQPTEAFVTIKSNVGELDEIFLRARNIDYEWDQITIPVDGRDLAADPVTISIAPSNTINDRFLLHAQGLRDAVVIGADSEVLAFEQNKRVDVEFVLTSAVDADGDGFERCNEPGCDCQDNNRKINPFTKEVCDDQIDHNCSGHYKENCP